MTLVIASKLIQAPKCSEPDCDEPASIFVADHVALCSIAALKLYERERRG